MAVVAKACGYNSSRVTALSATPYPETHTMPSTSVASEQRRRFSRVLFTASARLLIGREDLPCEVRDLSLKGALLALAAPAAGTSALQPGQECTLELRLDEAEVVIRMEATISHLAGPQVGLACRSIDLDSVSHLRRLVELNVGDEAILQRELSALALAD